MRLIDADKFFNNLDAYSDRNKLQKMLDKQPTAYDIENVVEQLEDLEPFHVDGYGDDFVNLYDAIEIVKQGGSETDDVCEWKYYKDGIEHTYTLGCNDRVFSQGYETESKYCPCCRKKIKVVE